MKLRDIILIMLALIFIAGCQQTQNIEFQDQTALSENASEDSMGLEDLDSLAGDLEDKDLNSLEEDLNLEF